MIKKYHILRSTLILVLLSVVGANDLGSHESASMEKTVTAIRNCMASSPAPWPSEWQSEYIDTIRKEIESHQDNPVLTKRLEILQNGFQPYWVELRKSNDRPLFEVQLAQIRWYTENLMTSELPGEEDKKKLKNQYEDIWNYAAGSLLTQFPFLDPNFVKKAKMDHLETCFNNIESPLLPIFLRLMTEDRVEQIKQRWHDQRFSRVDIWRQLGGDSQPPQNSHHLLAQRSLEQLLSQVWKVAAIPPDYYRVAATNLMNVERQRLQAKSRAYRMERQLEREGSRQFLQTEQIGFLLAALVETAQQYPPKQPDSQSSSIRGGDVYNVNDVLSEK